MIELKDIQAARVRITGHIRRTPLLHSPFLDEHIGRKLFVKPECLQHTGSFKFRGASSAISHLNERGEAGDILAYSSGNHAQGIAAAARAMGRHATIIMPADAPTVKIKNTERLGAEVVLYDRTHEAREDVAAKVMEKQKLHLIKPFDNLDVIAGQGTIGFEIAEDLRAMGYDAADVLVCAGGGGLTSGIARAMHFAAPKARVRPVEPVGYDDVIRSLRSGKREETPAGPAPLWDAVATLAPGELTLPIMQEHCHEGFVVDEKETYAAMQAAFNTLRVVAEPGGAIALAAALAGKLPAGDDPIVALISGGNVDAEVFAHALTQKT